jgi:outer membrane protein insertion porin family
LNARYLIIAFLHVAASVFLSVPRPDRPLYGAPLLSAGEGVSAARLRVCAATFVGGFDRSNADAFDLEIWNERIGRRLAAYYGSVIDTIVVRGNDRTRPVTIIREMATRQGEPLEEELIRRDVSYLRGLGFFSDVDIAADRSGNGRCRIIVTVSERPGLFMKYPYPVVNYDFTDGVSYGFRWRIKNFRGYGEGLSISVLKRRDLEHGGGISWDVPWAGGRRLRVHSGLFTYWRLAEPQFGDFIKERTGVALAVGLPLTESLVKQVWISTHFSFERRQSRFSPDTGVGAAADFHRQNFVSTGLELSYDSRDNVLAPTRGIFGRAGVTRFTAVQGLAQQYTLYRAAGRLYIPLGWPGSLILATDADIREGDVPSFFEMELGGSGSVRGFEESGKGTAKLVQSVQIRKRIFGPRIFKIPRIGAFDVAVNSVFFVDNGALADCVTDFPRSRFHTTAGGGFEILSPIQDFIRIEAAYGQDDNAVFYLTSGSRF